MRSLITRDLNNNLPLREATLGSLMKSSLDNSISMPLSRTLNNFSPNVEMFNSLNFLRMMMEDPKEEDLSNFPTQRPLKRLSNFMTATLWEDQSRLRFQEPETITNSRLQEIIKTDSKTIREVLSKRVSLLETYHSLILRSNFNSILRVVEKSDQSELSKMIKVTAEGLDLLTLWTFNMPNKLLVNLVRRSMEEESM